MLQRTRRRVQTLPLGVRQFLKFATVGAMNTAIDWSLAFFLTYYTPIPRTLGGAFVNLSGAPLRPEAAAVWFAKIISSGTATINSFIWNRRWTFRVRDKQARTRQFAKFVTVNVVGMLLNSTITTLLIRPFLPEPPRIVFMACQATATAIVLFWNFFMNKYWTFKGASGVSIES
ncbi:MAG: GtrA-like protein [Fimbriimonadales bacterium]|nr:MAG: GtrA-like protein [Fimbriimonadales bacterium]